uniref:Putative comm domain-containing protein n=1 Tax=Amblyomma triste TaxID=251400 RepID=A0A023G7F2_AMBTT
MAQATRGIWAAADLIKRYPVEVQKALIRSCLRPDSAFSIEEVMWHVRDMVACVNEIFLQKAESCGALPEDLQAAYEASKCLVSALIYLKEAAFASLAEDLRLDAEVVALLQSVTTSNVGKQAGPLGKLVNVDWKIGVAAMSDLCKNLNSPFIMLQLTLEDSAHNQTRHTIELTVPEFQKFASTMQELHGIMSTM